MCVWRTLPCTRNADTRCCSDDAGEDTLRMDSPAKRPHHSSSVSLACPELPSTVCDAHDSCSRLLMRTPPRVCAHLRSNVFSHRNSATSAAVGLALLVGADTICASTAKRFATMLPFLHCHHLPLPPLLRHHQCSDVRVVASTS